MPRIASWVNYDIDCLEGWEVQIVGESITVGDALQKLGDYFVEYTLVVPNDNQLVLAVAIQNLCTVCLKLLAQEGIFEPYLIPKNLDCGANPRHG